MFSGKTSELLRRVRRYMYAKKQCVVIKYTNDTRYDAECVTTHDKVSESAINATSLSDVDDEKTKLADVIAVDEGQFFPDLVDFCEAWANQGKVVLVAALDSTFERKPFGNVLALVPLAEKIDKLSAVCKCGKDAAFSKRMNKDTTLEVIGGTEMYRATCRGCFYDPLPSSEPLKD